VASRLAMTNPDASAVIFINPGGTLDMITPSNNRTTRVRFGR
jgi:hypothetical protein